MNKEAAYIPPSPSELISDQETKEDDKEAAIETKQEEIAKLEKRLEKLKRELRELKGERNLREWVEAESKILCDAEEVKSRFSDLKLSEKDKMCAWASFVIHEVDLTVIYLDEELNLRKAIIEEAVCEEIFENTNFPNEVNKGYVFDNKANHILKALGFNINSERESNNLDIIIGRLNNLEIKE